MPPDFKLFQQQMMSPLGSRLFMLRKLPMGFLAGLKVVELQEVQAGISVAFTWLNKNPFRSVYFAVLSMAAELSTGLLGFGQLFKKNPPVSMLMIKMEGAFFKKAVGKTVFTCWDGERIKGAVAQAILTGEAQVVHCTSAGKNEQGEMVAEFVFTWSFKVKNRNA